MRRACGASEEDEVSVLRVLRRLFLTFWALAGSMSAGAGSLLPPGEYQVKAAYLVNFMRYVDWPVARVGPATPMRMCLLGRDPFGAALAALEGQQVNGRELRVRQIDGVDAVGECHLLFIADSEERRVGLILRALAGKSVLSVSDIDGFVEVGGAIGLLVSEGRVRFDINASTLGRDGLRASSRLLRLARNVLGA